MVKVSLLKEFLFDKKVGSVFPSSLKVVDYTCKLINFNKKLIIVEYGPGTGVFTKEILKKMNSKSKLIVVETNLKFVNLLKNIEDKRLVVINDGVSNIKEILKKLKIKDVDYFISGVPFYMINDIEKDKIIKDTYNLLDKNGIFIVYQFRKLVLKNLKEYFSDIKYHRKLFNIPSLIIFECRK